MKKTAIVLVGLAAGTATASAAPRLAAEERAPARAERTANATATGSTSASATATPADDFDAWLETSYGTPMTERATQLLGEVASTLGDVRVVATLLLEPVTARKKKPPRNEERLITYPRVDSRGDIVCANIATKGGSKRECHDSNGTWVSPDSLALDDLR